MRFSLLSACLLLFLVLGTGHASPSMIQTVEVSGGRVTLGDLGSNYPEDLRQIDLGRAPPPGGSRLISRAELMRQIKAAGFSIGNIELPASVRVKSAGETYSALQLVALVEPAVMHALKPGVKLTKLTTYARLSLSPDTKVGAIRLPPCPKRIGAARISLVAELTLNGEVTHRVPLAAHVVVSSAAAAFSVRQGAIVQLHVRRRSAHITARGQALVNADIGDVATFRIQGTGRVVKARVTSSNNADVLEGA